MKQKSNNKGITLIALIITIIILLVLSVVTITSISNSNIPQNAKDARNKYNFAEEKEKVILAVQEAILEGRGTVAKNGVESGMNSQFTSTGWQKVNWDDSEDYVRTLITASSRQYKINLNTGEVEYEKYPGLNVGDKINYTVAGYTGEWRVIDINQENVKIFATSNVEELEIDGNDAELGVWNETTVSYKNAENKLDEICSKYVNTKFAIQGKSVRAEDVDQITGYDKKTKIEGAIFQYNDSVTFNVDGGKIKYKVNNSGDFYETNFSTLKKPQSQNEITGEYTVTNTAYDYRGDGFVGEEKPSVTKLNDKSSNLYKMLFGNDDQKYWLASSYIYFDTAKCWFGLKSIAFQTDYTDNPNPANNVGFMSSMHGVLWDASKGMGYKEQNGVRPVITLKSDVKLTQTSENSGEWNIDI